MSANSLTERCPRCHGPMVDERDWAGAYSTCVMCGHVVNDAVILDKRFDAAAAPIAVRS